MSAGDLVACIQGLYRSGGCVKMVPPDNRCCFFLSLRLGVIIIGLVNFALYTLAFSWYIGTVGINAELDELEVSNLDISVFVMFCVQLMVNLLLIVGAVKRIPNHVFPWLCANAIVIALLMVMIFMLVFLGASRNSLSYHQYVSSLSLISILVMTDMFCCIVVFQFRKNLLLEERIRLEEIARRSAGVFIPSSPPPPPYEEAAPGPTPAKVPLEALEDPPPEYEAALAMLSSPPPPGPQLRKKSLTNHEV